MKQTQAMWGKEQSEKACAQLFLTWYNNQNRTSYHLERAEKAFPGLEKKWEFVARQNKTDLEWKAIEVKGLVTPDIGSKRTFWKDILRKVTEAANCRIKGTFVMSSPPDLTLKSREKMELIDVITETIIRIAPSLKEDQPRDLAPEIANQFSHWPQNKSGLCELSIKKTSNKGCEVVLGAVSKSELFEIKAGKVIEQDLFKIIAKANDQLKLAKDKGAKETILLLDCDPIFEKHEELRNRLAALDKGTQTNIDLVYLIPKLSSENSYRDLCKGAIKEEIRVIEVYSK